MVTKNSAVSPTLSQDRWSLRDSPVRTYVALIHVQPENSGRSINTHGITLNQCPQPSRAETRPGEPKKLMQLLCSWNFPTGLPGQCLNKWKDESILNVMEDLRSLFGLEGLINKYEY
ncbi:Protocadherin-18 [Manis pentadactyla]|nr:Protocadherin-18 [Manis pentadactyla]